MVRLTTISFVLIAISSLTFAESGHSPYVGQDKTEIKSLSTEEIQGYLSGKGMGLAKAAELNHYPGPRHVLDLAEELVLSKEQLANTKEIHRKMHTEAVSLGKRIVEKERILDTLFSEQKIDETQLQSVVSVIGRLQGQLRFVHLIAHLEMKQLLSPEQIDKYDQLRGYQEHGGRNAHQHHQHGQN